ncbi:hypothetical protein HPB47_013578 [Ixodes persulcatus]|uniref:Uncharacterized protein n=1 Tax=Ixodes persulcatus TaxID=34615 RepID=A0AC60R1M6_IXOPE|nr:hypothetical protein HPB47_013578 [Ixodes persulcatus]
MFKPQLQPSSTKAQEMTKKIGAFIARGLQPFSVVEEPSFIDMIRCAIPEAGDSYVCVTAHMMDQDYRQHAYALVCQPMPQEHTGENIAQFLRDVIDDWGLPDHIPIFVVTDNGRNFVSAVAKSNWSGLLCFAHTLQLCISDAKREVASFSHLCAKARSIVGRYKRSARARARLMDIQKDMHMAQHEVIQDVPTRWNSEYAMMERLVELRAPISLELCESDVDNLSSREWKLMAAAVKVLQPLDQATTELCADRYPTLSQVIPLVHCTEVVLREHVREGEEAASFARSLLRSIATRFPDVKMALVPANAMLVDPRYKDICYTEESKKKWAKATLVAAATELMPEDCAQTSACPDTEKPPANTLWGVFSSLSSSVVQQSANDSVSRQVADYLGTPVLPRSENPLEWWKSHGSRMYPALARVAQKYLSIPATQARSERLFSTAGNRAQISYQLLTARATPSHVYSVYSAANVNLLYGSAVT